MNQSITCDESERSGIRCTSVYTINTGNADDTRTAAMLAGWSSDGALDRCAMHTHTRGPLGGADVPVDVQGPDGEHHDLLRQTWEAVSEWEIRRRYPWAHAPYATITTHEGRFVIYSDADTPDVVIARFDAEPHRLVLLTTVYRRDPADVTLDTAILAATERKLHCSFVSDAA